MQFESQPQFQEHLVRGLTHRMNNILTVFHGYVGLMLENQALDAATRDGLSRIKAGARAATELMDRTHSLVRQPAVVWREIDLADFLHMLHPAIESIRKSAAKVEVVAPANLPKVWADTGRLRTAVLEIVRNAIEAAPAKRGLVRVVLSCASGADCGEAAETVSLAVIDNGPGIPPEVASKIYQPFFSTKKKHDANGLGLNVAHGLIEQCGGTLRHESRPGETKFEILLATRRHA
jgi:two-component system cell cycle sensor histidine kinase/response regulator CckA